MLDLGKFRTAIEEKIRFIEMSATGSILNMADYARLVGHKIGLNDAIVILDETLSEQAQQEAEDDSSNENAG